ncbi:MAG: mandelate racemase/muconate lactonizing enzyme family protein [Actinomycetota bacterium]
MKVTGIAVHQLDMPVVGGGFEQSGGRVWRTLDTTIVRLQTDTGLVGWGETCPFGSNYLNASPRTARAGLLELAPELLGCDPREIGSLRLAMDRALYGHPHVKTAYDMAAWDLLGKASGMPVFRLMGGRLTADLAPHTAFLKLDVSDVTQELVRGFKARGCNRFEFKASGDPGTDIAMIRLIGAYLSPGDVIKIDVNQGWRVDQAIAVARELDGLPVLFEEPCATYDECLAFKRSTGRPMSLDECILGVRDLLRAVEDQAIDTLNLKIGRVGGLTPARRLRDLAADLGIPMYIQDTAGGDICAAATAHLAHSTPPGVFISAWDCASLVTVETATGLQRDPSFLMRAPDAPGLGVEPIPEVLGEPVAEFS